MACFAGHMISQFEGLQSSKVVRDASIVAVGLVDHVYQRCKGPGTWMVWVRCGAVRSEGSYSTGRTAQRRRCCQAGVGRLLVWPERVNDWDWVAL